MNAPKQLRPLPENERHALTAERISLAVVAAAKAYGDDPVRALQPGAALKVRRCLSPAAFGLCVATGQPVAIVARLLGIASTSVPTARKGGGELFQSAAGLAAEAVWATMPPPGPALELPPVVGRPNKPRPAQPGPVLASTGISHHRAYAPPPANPALRAAEAANFDAPEPVRQRAASIGRTIAARRTARVIRMMPVTATKLRYARWFLAAGWDLEETAFLFDVGADALADAVQPEAA